MKSMQFVCATFVGFMLLAGLTGCGATAPNRTADLGGVYSGEAQNLYGKLRIAFTASEFNTQATAAEVNSLKLTVSGEKLAAAIVKTVARADSSAVEFPGLPIGAISLKVQALNASGNEIGVINQDAIEIQAGKTTKVALKLKLNPTVVSEQNGNLETDLTIEDGDVVNTNPTPAPTAAPAGFSDGFENGLANWDVSFAPKTSGSAVTNWTASSLSASAGSKCATAGDAEGKVESQGTYTLSLKNGVNLSASSNPAMTFKLNNFVPKYYFRNAKLVVEATTGSEWTQVAEVTEAVSSWKEIPVSLAGFKASSVKVRFRFTYESVVTTGKHSAPQIDEVTIK